MRLISTLASAAVACTAWGQEMPKPKALPKFPPGSTVSGLVLPSYDDERRLQSTLSVAFLEVLDQDTFGASGIEIVRYGADTIALSRLQFDKASINRLNGILTSDSDISITDPAGRLTAKGVRLDVRSRQTWFVGPGQVEVDPEALKNRMTSRSLITSALLCSASVAPWSNAAPATIPGDVSAARLQQIEELQQPAAPRLRANAPSGDIAPELIERADAVDSALKAFAQQADITVQADCEKQALPQPDPAVLKQQFRISATFDGGAYVDPEALALVFVDNIELVDRLEKVELKCLGEAKAFFTEAEKKEGEEKKEGGSALSKFGDLLAVTGTGGIAIQRTFDDGSLVRLTGAEVHYDAVKKEIIVSGGRPTLTHPQGFMQAANDDQRIVLHADGTYSAIGKWQIEGTPPAKRKKGQR